MRKAAEAAVDQGAEADQEAAAVPMAVLADAVVLGQERMARRRMGSRPRMMGLKAVVVRDTRRRHVRSIARLHRPAAIPQRLRQTKIEEEVVRHRVYLRIIRPPRIDAGPLLGPGCIPRPAPMFCIAG